MNASSDPDAHVQFQVALTLSKVTKTTPIVFEALNKIISTHIEDPWFQTAVLLGASDNGMQWYEAYKDFKAESNAEIPGKKTFLRKISSIIGAKYEAREMSVFVKMISAIKDTGTAIPGLQGMADGMKRNAHSIKLTPEGQHALIALISGQQPDVGTAAIEIAQRLEMAPSAELTALISKAKEIAGDDQAPAASRVTAIKILGLDPREIPFYSLGKLLQPGQSAEVQLAAVNVLLSSRQQPATGILLEKWGILSPRVHEVVEAGFLSVKERIESLMKAVENDKIKPEWISRNTQNRLLKHSDSTIRERAKGLFKSIKGADREKLIIDYNVATTITGDPAKGRTVFKTVCSACHSLEGVGADFGPDLHSVSHQTKINLLTMILHPNNDIAAGYEGYTIETPGGTPAGIISGENDESILLKTPGGAEQTILKRNIKAMSPMSVSLMPEGLESSISKEGMADLLEYIKTLK
jgi:putative heme-binding domain-containing protein